MANSIGKNIQISSFGESHGPMVGVVIDGFPSGFAIDETQIQAELKRRKPGQSSVSTSRQEADEFSIVSGVFEGKTTGSPIAILIPNTNQAPKDYDALKDLYRPGHADFTYQNKYGHRDHRGGGRSSARITAAWVAAGALCKQYLAQTAHIAIQAVVAQIGHIEVDNIFELDWQTAEDNSVRCPHPAMALAMQTAIESTAAEGDSLGGQIACKIQNCPVGLGEPVFDKLNADLAKAIFSINAVKGLSFGSGFEGAKRKGSQNNDSGAGNSNHDGGITGGISNGKDICLQVAFKPTSSIALPQTMLQQNGDTVTHQIQGRHDPCVVPRAVPIVEAMCAITLMDHLLLNLKYKF